MPWLALALCFLQDPAPAADGKAETPTLEELLLRARALGAARRRELAPRVQALVERLLETRPGALGADARATIQTSLRKLGPGAAPLILEALANPKLRQEDQLEALVGALEELELGAVHDRLVELVQSPDARLAAHAIRLVAGGIEPERSRALLTQVLAGKDEAKRLAVVEGLRRAGGAHRDLIVNALEDKSAAVVAAALAALAEEPGEAADTAVRSLLARPVTAAPNLRALLAYYEARPKACGRDEAVLFTDLISFTATRDELRLLVLEKLPDLHSPFHLELKRRLERLTEGENREVREAAMVCLAVAGDRSMRRELVRVYDALVEENERWPQAWAQRATLYLRLREYPSAVRNFERALELPVQGRDSRRAWWIGLARALVLDDKLRQAEEVLGESPLEEDDLRALARDPDFEPLREHPRYGAVLRPSEG